MKSIGRRDIPLGAVLALHGGAALWLIFGPDNVMSASLEEVLAEALFMVQISLIAIWAARQANLWRRLPWAVGLMAISIGLMGQAVIAFGDYSFGYYISLVLAILAIPHAVVMFAVVRRAAPPPAEAGRSRFGLRHLLAWTAAAAITLQVGRMLVPPDWRSLPLDLMGLLLKIYLAIDVGNLLLAAPVAVMAVSKRFLLPWLAFAFLVFPFIPLAEHFVVGWISGTPFDLLSAEGWFYYLSQLLVLTATLAAWRYSGRLLP